MFNIKCVVGHLWILYISVRTLVPHNCAIMGIAYTVAASLSPCDVSSLILATTLLLNLVIQLYYVVHIVFISSPSYNMDGGIAFVPVSVCYRMITFSNLGPLVL